MSFGHYTPEALLPRSDSKNPATTCKGLTSAGRPCRRALAASASNSPAASPSANKNGVVAVLDEGDAAAFFCWQHKDQAEALVAKLNKRTQVLPLQQKSSIDTLVERIGVLELDDEVGNDIPQQIQQPPVQAKHRRPRENEHGSRKRDTLPQEWQRIQGPLMSVPEEVVELQGYERPSRSSRPPRQRPSEQYRRPAPKTTWFCCSRVVDEDLPPPRRRDYRHDRQRSRSRSRPREYNRSRPNSTVLESRPPPQRSSPVSTPIRRKPIQQSEMQQFSTQTIHYPQLDQLPPSPVITPTRRPARPSPHSSPPNTQTATLLSLIPPHLPPTTTSALLTELSKPISPADESGYIYIFWLTPETDDSKPDDETASSLLDIDNPQTPTPSPSSRRLPHNNSNNPHALTTQALQRFASIKRNPNDTRKILLKIGRASNVHRRLSQWTKQCGQNITLIRFYPYSNAVSRRSNADLWGTGRKVPHVHRVERLIHLELADQRAQKERCDRCGREHKEWFEVEATRNGVRSVDEVVRRWVEWGERQGSLDSGGL